MFNSLEEYIQTVTERFNKPRRNLINEGLLKQDIVDGLIDVARFVSITNSAEFIQAAIDQAELLKDAAGASALDAEETRLATEQLRNSTLAFMNLTEKLKNDVEQLTTTARKFQDSWDMLANIPNLADMQLGHTDVGKFWKVNEAAVGGTVTNITGKAVTANIGDEFTWNGLRWVWNKYSDPNSKYLSLLKPSFTTAQIPRIVPSSTYTYNLYSGVGVGNYTHQSGWYFPKVTKQINQVGIFLFKDKTTGDLTGTAKVEVLHKRGSTVTVLVNQQVSNADIIKCNTLGYSGHSSDYEVKVSLNQTIEVVAGDSLFVAIQVFGKFTHFIGTSNYNLASGEWNTGSPALCYRAGDQSTTPTADFIDIPALPAGVNSYMPIHFYESTQAIDLDRVRLIEQLNATLEGKVAMLENNPPSRKLPVVGESNTVFTIKGVQARIVTSSGYNYKGDPDTLMIICHGNGQSHASGPSASARAFLAANKISYAIINTQDDSEAPYETNAVGWGNDITIRRNKEMYDYLQDRYNFHKGVILAGQSMGGLAMGNIVYQNVIPVKFCIGIGPVPSLKYMFTSDNYADSKRRAGIRAAYGMRPSPAAPADGPDDADLDLFIQGYDWRWKNSVTINGQEFKTFGPNLYIIVGSGDVTFSNDFGGSAKYLELVSALRRGGTKVTYTEKALAGHADASIWDDIISSGVFYKEMGLAIP